MSNPSRRLGRVLHQWRSLDTRDHRLLEAVVFIYGTAAGVAFSMSPPPNFGGPEKLQLQTACGPLETLVRQKLCLRRRGRFLQPERRGLQGEQLGVQAIAGH